MTDLDQLERLCREAQVDPSRNRHALAAACDPQTILGLIADARRFARLHKAAQTYIAASEAEARALGTAENAKANFSDPRPEIARAGKAVTAAAVAFKALCEATDGLFDFDTTMKEQTP